MSLPNRVSTNAAAACGAIAPELSAATCPSSMRYSESTPTSSRLHVEQVVRVVGAILATIAADAVVDRRESVGQQVRDLPERSLHLSGKGMVAVHGLPVAARRQAQLLHRLPTPVRVDRALPQERANIGERGGRVGEPLADFRRQFDGSRFLRPAAAAGSARTGACSTA